jgi:hypothetical protein
MFSFVKIPDKHVQLWGAEIDPPNIHGVPSGEMSISCYGRRFQVWKSFE